ncbi:hypothetical protein ACOWK2_05580 [Helicobacter pylori]
MPNTTAEKDYTKYSEKQLFNFLNSIKTKQKRALEKLKEIQAQKQRIKKTLQFKTLQFKTLQFKALHLTENGYTIEEEREILARAKDTKNHLCFKSIEDFKKHCENLRFKNADD